jgi:hypothetical protein
MHRQFVLEGTRLNYRDYCALPDAFVPQLFGELTVEVDSLWKPPR